MNLKRFLLPKLHLNIERWRFSSEYDIYVSNLGNFRRPDGKEVKAKVSSADGYMVVNLPNNRRVYAHRIVASTWCKNDDPDNKTTVDHLNHNKRDNSAANLEWVSRRENHTRSIEDTSFDEAELNNRIKNLLEKVKQAEKKNHELQTEISKMIASGESDSTPYVRMNGRVISKGECELIKMSYAAQPNLQKHFDKKISNFVDGVNPNKEISINGVKYTRI